MDEDIFIEIASQLRRPHGEVAAEVAQKMNEGNFQVNQNTLQLLRPSPGDRILEIGMGNGFFVKDIVSRGEDIHYTGCDFSPEMVIQAAKLNEALVNEGKASFIQASAESLPFKNQRFNKVFTVNTVYFWKNPVNVFREIRRVLKPRGILIIAGRPKSIMQHFPFVKYGFNMFSKEELIDLMTENWFSVSDALEIDEPNQVIGDKEVKVVSLMVCGIRL